MPTAVLNSTADTIPPGGAMEPVGTADANGRVRVRKPTRSDSLAVLLNGPTPIPAGEAGAGAVPWDGPLAAAVDPAYLDADGFLLAAVTTLGTLAGSWYLTPGRMGFVPQAGAVQGLVPVQADPAVAAGGGSGSGSGSGGSTGPGTFVTSCNVVSGGVVVATRLTFRRDDGGTYCEDVPTCTPSGCPTLWYCTTTGVQSWPVGPAPPAGYGSPYPTEAAARAFCTASSGGGSSGSGSGSGSGGGTVSNTCCPPTLPDTLTLTISGGGGSFPMTWSAGDSAWLTGLITVPGCGTMRLSLSCGGSGANNLTLANAVGSPDCTVSINALSYTRSCSPFSVSATGTASGFGTCGCDGATRTFTVTA